jgi:hypothetical protein
VKSSLLLAALMLAVFSRHASAQADHQTSLSSTVPDAARFEVVQSPMLAKLTFRLDRFTGETWLFVTTKDNSYAWERVNKIPLPDDTKVPEKVNYQIFLSGIRAQVTVLVNINTGASWYVAEDPKTGVFWSPMQ